MNKLILLLLLLTPLSLASEPKRPEQHVECLSGNVTLFSKPVDEVIIKDNVVIVIKHKTRYTFVNASCMIQDSIM